MLGMHGTAYANFAVTECDLLIAVGGKSVASRFAVQRALGVLAEGDPVRLALVRNGTIVDVDLGPRPGETQK